MSRRATSDQHVRDRRLLTWLGDAGDNAGGARCSPWAAARRLGVDAAGARRQRRAVQRQRTVQHTRGAEVPFVVVVVVVRPCNPHT